MSNSLSLFLRRASPTIRSAPPLSFIRHESNSRRQTKRLRLPPHEDFCTRLTANTPSIDHILHNPPASAPSVYTTPTLFLPKDDPRRGLPPTLPPITTRKNLPSPLTAPREKTYHLTPEDFEKMRALRASNPSLWTRKRLAQEFGTSQFFAGMVAEASEERKAKMAKAVEKAKQRWGQRKIAARRDRAKRRAGWGGADGY